MKNVELFILTFMEITSIILLWSSIGLNAKRPLLRKFAIITLTSALVIIMNKYLPSTGNIINYIFLIAAIKVAFNKKISKVLAEFCLVISLGMITQLILMVIIIGLNRISGGWDFYREGIFINSALLLISISIYQFVPIGRYYERYGSGLNKMYIFIINLMAYIISLKLIWEYNHDYIVNGLIFFTIATIAFILLNVIYFVKNFKLEEQKKIIDSHNKYNLILSNIMGEVRRRQHDFKNHLNTIYGIVEVADDAVLRDELKNYISSLNSSLSDIDKVIHIKNSVISAVIYSKNNEAKNRGINFFYEVKDGRIGFPIEDYELSEILNNLLDNAFEAADNRDFLRREVYLEIGEEEEGKYIEVGNSGPYISPEDIQLIFAKGFSTKKEDGHGYGLYNVKRIVEGKNGQIQLSSEGGYTIFRILF